MHVLLTLHVNELPGQLVIWGVECVKYIISDGVHFGRGDDQLSCVTKRLLCGDGTLQVMFL